MPLWKRRLYGFTGLFIVLGIWTPSTWLMTSLKERHHLVVFELHRLPAVSLFIFLVVLAATAAAQWGFILIAQDLARSEADDQEFR